MHVSKYWMVAAVWALLYVESGRTEEISLDLDDVQMDNFTTKLTTVTPTSLSGWYKMTNGFLSAVHSKSEETLDIIIHYAEQKKIELPDSIVSMLKVQYAMFACVVIGFLFTVTMFIIGITFFCCRMCGRCGGKRVQIVTSSTGFWRNTLILLLLIFLALLMPAVISMFIINNSLNSSFSETEKTITTSLYDVEIFLNNTEKQVGFIAKNGVKKTVTDITKQITDVENFIQSELKKMGFSLSFEEPKELLVYGWPKIAKKVEELFDAGENIMSATLSIKQAMKDIHSNLKSAKEQCSEENKKKCNEIDLTVFELNNNADINMSPLNEIKIAFEKLDVEDYEKILTDFLKSFNNIPSEMGRMTWPIRKDVIQDLRAFGKEVLESDNLQSLLNFTNLARNTVQKLRHETKKKFPEVHRYDDYRWYVGLVISIIIAIVAGGVLLGLLFGVCCYRYDRSATKRTTMSNVAGLILMFSVYWMFLFSGLLMLITTLLFAVGGTVEVYLCRPLFDENFQVLDQVMDAIQSTALNESSIAQNIVPSNALKKCAGNATAYEAFNLEYMNLTAMLDYKEKLKLEKRLQELQAVKPPELIILTDHANKAINVLDNALSIDISQVVLEKLEENFIVDYSAQVKNILEINDEKLQVIGKHATVLKNNLHAFIGSRTLFSMGLQNISTVLIKTKGHLQAMVQGFKMKEKELAASMPMITSKITEKFVKQLTDYGDNIIGIVIESFEKKIAPCYPLWNVFDSSRTVLCKYYIQPLNGIWFAIGWSLFLFIPIIIVSTKLSKHFLIMKHVASSENDEKNPYDIELSNGYKVKPDDGWYSPSHHL